MLNSNWLTAVVSTPARASFFDKARSGPEVTPHNGLYCSAQKVRIVQVEVYEKEGKTVTLYIYERDFD